MTLPKTLFLLSFLCILDTLNGQALPFSRRWQHGSMEKDNVYGLSTQKAYELLKGREAKDTITVAIIDSGVDIDHPDLKDVIWTNPGEIPGNGIDDDRNGYTDDVHGWNFIGGADGRDVDDDTFEVTRQYLRLKNEIENTAAEGRLSSREKKQRRTLERDFQKVRTLYEELCEPYRRQLARIENLRADADTLKEMIRHLAQLTGKDDFTEQDLSRIRYSTLHSPKDRKAANLVGLKMRGFELKDASLLADSIRRETRRKLSRIESDLPQNCDPKFDPRPLVGDNPKLFFERGYGNDHYEGPDARHGTHVAGIIAASRDNKIGMDGVASPVRLMILRVVPDGDERDKDVANAILYAADNGAKVINMSFGKALSPDAEKVREAIRYAASKDVLMVHAAGNNGQDLDRESFFPNVKGMKKTARSWIEVGALTEDTGERLPARFSNYGKKTVDLFAPGTSIYSTVPHPKNTDDPVEGYESLQGTSMASPMVAGTAALLRAYFPEFTAPQIKELILKGAVPLKKQKVIRPGEKDTKKDTVRFGSLSRTGAAANAANSMESALKKAGKK